MEPTLILLLLAMLGLMFYSSRKRKAQVEKLAESVKVGARAVMLGGITGTIIQINDDSVVVESTPGTKIEFMKAAVRNIVEPSLEATPKKAAAKKTTPTKKTAK